LTNVLRYPLHAHKKPAYNPLAMPILDPHSMEFISRSAEQTRRAGMRLGALLQAGDVVCLAGELGSGKTTLVQGIAAGWGSLDAVSSPTFVLVNLYRQPEGRRLFHMDTYRLTSAAEAEDLDLDGMLEAGPLVIEWADRIQEVLPGERLWVALRWVDDSQRDLLISARGRRYQALLLEFRRQVFGVP
jgi:tRNA threonylcarbamoyladenosine biosynthesis protein TsaE